MVSHGGFVAYYRVSTDKQGKSGLGIEERARLPHPRRFIAVPFAGIEFGGGSTFAY